MGAFFQILLGSILLYAAVTGRAGKLFTAVTGFATPKQGGSTPTNISDNTPPPKDIGD